MYDPGLGRFTTIDPWAEKYNNQSTYLYAYNNPVRFTDFLGLGAEDNVDEEDKNEEKEDPEPSEKESKSLRRAKLVIGPDGDTQVVFYYDESNSDADSNEDSDNENNETEENYVVDYGLVLKSILGQSGETKLAVNYDVISIDDLIPLVGVCPTSSALLKAIRGGLDIVGKIKNLIGSSESDTEEQLRRTNGLNKASEVAFKVDTIPLKSANGFKRIVYLKRANTKDSLVGYSIYSITAEKDTILNSKIK